MGEEFRCVLRVIIMGLSVKMIYSVWMIVFMVRKEGVKFNIIIV